MKLLCISKFISFFGNHKLKIKFVCLKLKSPQETASMADETSSSGNKEDEDDDEEDDKLDGPSQDPERLKAFNVYNIANLFENHLFNVLILNTDVCAAICG